jgi:hypothetical protein
MSERGTITRVLLFTMSGVGMVASSMPLAGGGLKADDKPVALVVEAWISTAGPYGESWDLRLTPSGEASLRVNYMTAPAGNLMGRFTLSAEQVVRIRTAIESERFFAMPAKVFPATVPLHRPALRLDVWLGERHHSVQLYDPDQQKADPNVRRFLGVWSRLFESLPLRPSWGGPQNNQIPQARPG